MKKFLPAAVAAALIVGGSTALLHGAAADAQAFDSLRQKQKGKQEEQQPRRGRCQLQAPEGQRAYSLSTAECEALAPVLQALGAGDWAAAQAALAAAQAAAQGGDARYLVGQATLRIGIETGNAALQAQAVDAMIESGAAQAAELPRLLRHQLDFALQTRDFDKAERALARLVQLNPNDPDLVLSQAALRSQRGDAAGALALYRSAIQGRESAGQPVPEDWRKRALALAYSNRMGPEALALSRELVAAHPTAENWRDALIIYRELGNPDPSLNLDLYRLMRAAGALAGERDYIEYAEAANSASAWGEVKAVLEEGLSRNAIAGNADYARERLAASSRRAAEDRPTLASQRAEVLAGRDARDVVRLADAFFGYGQYAEAAELYRAALEKGGDANLVNTRLGAALALAGRRAEAEAALRAVTGPRRGLAEYWLLWLSRRS